MARQATLALIVALIGATTFAAEENRTTGDGVGDYLGRWNVLILEEKDTFASSWFGIEKVDGKLQGAIVWKWGSRTPLRDVAVVDGELRFRRGRDRFRARIVGDELRGSRTARDGSSQDFVGRRAPEMCDVAGTWKTVGKGERADRTGTVVLAERDGRITGHAVDPEGRKYSVEEASLDGHVLRFHAVADPPDGLERNVRFEIRGDRVEGIVSVVQSGEAEPRELRFSGERERSWGQPVELLAKEGTEGWRPRDPNRKLGWKVEGGILENKPRDVDIVSEKNFRDFRLHLEYKVEEGSNSGVYLRGRYELQVLGRKDVQPHGNMAVYGLLSPQKNPMRDFDEWQTLEVTFIGRWVTVTLNGETVHDNAYLDGITGGAIDPWEGEPGPLMLQGDHGRVQFRNVVVTPAK